MPANVEQTVQGILDSLISALLRAQPADRLGPGLRVMVDADRLLRWYSAPAEGVLIAESCSRNSADDFEIFLVPHESGELRVGWRRRWAEDSEPPGVWQCFAKALTIEGPSTPRSDPDFAVLLAALCAGTTPVIDYADSDARASLAADVRHLRDVVDRQASQLRKLQLAASARVIDPQPQAAPEFLARQWALADIAEWADLHADTITILPRAIAEAKKADLESEQLAFDALDLLANTYRLVKQSQLPREEYKAQAERLGLFIGGSITAPGMHGDAYYVQYGGRRRLLDQHLGRGTSRDSRYSLRVYFFWDEDTQRVVVGWLPSHLPNSLT